MSLWQDVVWREGKFLGIEWHAWKVVGWAGNAVFTSRFLVQWYATEKHRRVTVPALFWWLSLVGALLLLAYAVFHLHDSVIVASNAFSWILYGRNLIIHRRAQRERLKCEKCGVFGFSGARYCSDCGTTFQQSPTC